MEQIFGQNGTPNVSYVTRPADGGYSSILTFSELGPEGIDRAFLCENATIDFGRQLSKSYFINHAGIAYILGRGTGSLNLRGMLGHAEDFAALFGESASDPCDGLYTVKLDAFGMVNCDFGQDTGTIIMEGVSPTRFTITAETQRETGALWYTANAIFEISGIKVQEGTQGQNSQRAAQAFAGLD